MSLKGSPSRICRPSDNVSKKSTSYQLRNRVDNTKATVPLPQIVGSAVGNATDKLETSTENKSTITKTKTNNKPKNINDKDLIKFGLEYKPYDTQGLSDLGPAKPCTNINSSRTCSIGEPLKNTEKPLFTRNKHKRVNVHGLGFGTYNVRSLKEVWKLYTLCEDAEKFNIDFIGIQEHKIRSKNHISCIRGNNLNYEFYFTSADNGGDGGVGILIHKKHVDYIRNIKSISGRSIRISLNYDPRLIIVCTYSPTERAKKAEIEAYYENLEYVDVGQSVQDLFVVLGDFNARVGGNGPNEQGNTLLIDKTTSRNGKLLNGLCEKLGLCITSAKFLNTVDRKYTWVHPETGRRSEKDHILISKNYINSVINCRAYNSVYINSDHRIKVMRIAINIKKQYINRSGTVHYAYENLKNFNVVNKYAVAVNNKYEALMSLETDPTIQTKYDIIEASVKHANEAVLGKNKHPVNKYISDATRNLISQKDELRKKYLTDRNPKNKDEWLKLKPKIRDSLAEDKKKMLNNILSGIEKDYASNNVRNMYRKIDVIGGNFKNKLVISTDNDDDQVETARKFFDKLLNNSNVPENTETTNGPGNKPKQPKLFEQVKYNMTQPINTDDITANEIRGAIQSFSNNKAPGCDDIKAEVLKNMDDKFINVIKDLCNEVYNNNVTPDQWRMNTIIPIHKKGNKSDINNYRGISLMSIVAKTYNKILLNRIYDPINSILGDNQAGFRRKRSTVEHVHVLNRIVEDAKINKKPYFMIFVDFQKAFDSIDRNVIWKILKNIGVPDKIIKAISCLYTDTKSKVLVNGKLSEEIRTKTGIIQGDTLSPFLFIIVMDYVFKLIAPKYKGKGYNFADDLNITELLFADDVALIGSKSTEVIGYLEELMKKAQTVGLKINYGKTKYLTNTDCERWAKQKKITALKEMGIDRVDDFKYLGCGITDLKKEIKNRKGQAWGNFWKLGKIWKSPDIDQMTKIRIANALILPIFLYGSEAWTLTETLKEKINAFGRNIYRAALGLRRIEKTKNEKLYDLTDSTPLYDAVKKRQIKYLDRLNNSGIGIMYKILNHEQTFEKSNLRKTLTNQRYLKGLTHAGVPDGA
jgi:hypothetical protein